MTDVVLGYRGDCKDCPAFAFSEDRAVVESWGHEHVKHNSNHLIDIWVTRAYEGPMLKHQQHKKKEH